MYNFLIYPNYISFDFVARVTLSTQKSTSGNGNQVVFVQYLFVIITFPTKHFIVLVTIALHGSKLVFKSKRRIKPYRRVLLGIHLVKSSASPSRFSIYIELNCFGPWR